MIVQLTGRARSDILAIRRYLVEQAGARTAIQVIARLRRLAQMLTSLPDRGNVPPERPSSASSHTGKSTSSSTG